MENKNTQIRKGPIIAISLALTAVLVFVDQVSKYIIVQRVKPVGAVAVIRNFFYLTYLENRGAAFGSMSDMRWLFMPLTAVGCVGLLVFLIRYKNHTFWSCIAITLVLAGGVGNMIDRVVKGYVVDFLDFPFFGYIFNFADCCVVVGAVFILIAYTISERNDKRQKEALERSGGDEAVEQS